MVLHKKWQGSMQIERLLRFIAIKETFNCLSLLLINIHTNQLLAETFLSYKGNKAIPFRYRTLRFE